MASAQLVLDVIDSDPYKAYIMSSPLWDPDCILQVTNGAPRGMFCLGQARSRYDSRCRWNVPHTNYLRICSMLTSISMRLPHTVSYNELSSMASLGLCSYHVDQEAEVVDKWEKILASIEHLHGEYQQSLQSNEETLEAMSMDVHKCRVLIQCSPDSDETLSIALRRYVRRYARIKRELEADRTTLASLRKSQVNTETLQKEKAELSRKASSLSQRLTTAEQVIQRQNSEHNMRVDDLRKARDELRAEREEKDLQIEHLRKQKNDLEQRLEEKSTELDSACLVSQGLRRDRESLQSELETVKEEIEVLKKNEMALSTHSNTLSTTLRHTEQELSTSCQANKHLTERLEKATVQLTNLQDKLHEMHMKKSFSILQKLKGWIQDSWRAVTGWSRQRRTPASDEEEGLALAAVDDKFNSINAAGVVSDQPLLQRDPISVKRRLEINSLGTYYSVRLAVEQMVKQPLRSPDASVGSIVAIASIAAHQASKGQCTSDYCMSKGAVLLLTKQLGVELAEHGIRVNCLSPGYITTDLTADLVDKHPKLGEIFNNEPPLKRMGKRSDLKAASVFLLSDASSYMTSTEMLVTGGPNLLRNRLRCGPIPVSIIEA
ncbi:hypothetical protein BBP40_009193 [Aspergillus hancockii]|nr:hypothetical protein BBP40_009193 [Aspergillus hancockii]